MALTNGLTALLEGLFHIIAAETGVGCFKFSRLFKLIACVEYIDYREG